MHTYLSGRYAQCLGRAGAILADHELAQSAGVTAEVVRVLLGGVHLGLMVAACLPYPYEQQELLTIDGHVYHVARLHVKHPYDASRDVDLTVGVEGHIWTTCGLKYSLHDGVLCAKVKE